MSQLLSNRGAVGKPAPQLLVNCSWLDRGLCGLGCASRESGRKCSLDRGRSPGSCAAILADYDQGHPAAAARLHVLGHAVRLLRRGGEPSTAALRAAAAVGVAIRTRGSADRSGPAGLGGIDRLGRAGPHHTAGADRVRPPTVGRAAAGSRGRTSARTFRSRPLAHSSLAAAARGTGVDRSPGERRAVPVGPGPSRGLARRRGGPESVRPVGAGGGWLAELGGGARVPAAGGGRVRGGDERPAVVGAQTAGAVIGRAARAGGRAGTAAGRTQSNRPRVARLHRAHADGDHDPGRGRGRGALRRPGGGAGRPAQHRGVGPGRAGGPGLRTWRAARTEGGDGADPYLGRPARAARPVEARGRGGGAGTVGRVGAGAGDALAGGVPDTAGGVDERVAARGGRADRGPGGGRGGRTGAQCGQPDRCRHAYGCGLGRLPDIRARPAGPGRARTAAAR